MLKPAIKNTPPIIERLEATAAGEQADIKLYQNGALQILGVLHMLEGRADSLSEALKQGDEWRQRIEIEKNQQIHALKQSSQISVTTCTGKNFHTLKFLAGDGKERYVNVSYISGFARDDKGQCAFCHGDPCGEAEYTMITPIKEFKQAMGKGFETCPMCKGEAS